MKLIIFLGNPGLRYRKTRHNLGFMVADFYARARGLKWQKSAKFQADIAESNSASEKVLLIKPLLFYNLSGPVVKKLADFYQVPPQQLLVVCDDLNLNFGQVRLRNQGSGGGNNGLKSIAAALGTNQFARLRVGTDNELRQQLGDTDFVLSKLSRPEQARLTHDWPEIAEKIDGWLTGP